MINKEIVEKHGEIFADGWPNWFDIGDGWLSIVDEALTTIKQKMTEGMPKVEINQIKEKFGGLRIYFDGGNDETGEIIEKAVKKANNTCDTCGTTENVGYTTGWIATICEDCAKKEDKLDRWKLNEKKIK